jgi:hypothetical protein
VNRLLLAELARRAPLLPGKETVAFVDIDSQQKRVYGRKKQGAAFGHAKIQSKSLLVRGLNALAAAVSTPLGAPVIAAARLRGGNAASSRGAASFAAEAVRTARAAGCSGTVVVRADSAFYSAAFAWAVRAAGAFFSLTVQMNPHAAAAIAAIGEDAWTPIRCPRAIWDDQLGCWVSDAEVAETSYTAFTRRKGQEITARLIVRRVRDLNCEAGQDELFPVWRYHALRRYRRKACYAGPVVMPTPARAAVQSRGRVPGLRHNSCWSEAIEEGQEGVGSAVARVVAVVGRDAGEGLFFEGHVGVQVDLGCRDGFVAQPQRDDGDVVPSVQQCHSRGMPEDVR